MNPSSVARIGESACIGCTLCLAACPTAAIVGARGFMHTVVPPLCTGCELCLPPCPVDCIVMVDRGAASTMASSPPRRDRAADPPTAPPRTAEQRRAAVAAAFARARERRGRTRSPP